MELCFYPQYFNHFQLPSSSVPCTSEVLVVVLALLVLVVLVVLMLVLVVVHS